MFLRGAARIFFLFLLCYSLSAHASDSVQATEIVFKETIPELMLSGESWRYKNGDSYVGQWLHNKPHGTGVYERMNGDVYHGEFRNGLLHGMGDYQFANGDLYKGEWDNGFATGYGELFYQNGNHYAGGWRQGKREGEGVLRYRSGSVYEGHWVADKKEGKGLMSYRNGERYIGDYKNNKPHGNGVKTTSTGQSYRGTFSKGVPHGVGECNRDGGKMRVCLYNKGRQIKDSRKLELAKAYYEKNQPVYEFEGGIAYHLQDEYTKARYYITTRNVWWEKTVALLETQLRIRSEDKDQFLYLVVNRYTGPGIYHLQKGDILASSLNGDAIELADDIVASLEITSDKANQIDGVFNIPLLAGESPGEHEQHYRIFDGRFEASASTSAYSDGSKAASEWVSNKE
ncbi:MORN repeat-containing protein [Ketobacter sp.]